MRPPVDVLVDGRLLRVGGEVHLLQHKPIGVVTALSDPMHPTAAGLLGDVPRRGDLRPIGRLDLDTSGLLLWTTDGQLLHRWTHPKNAVPRTYQAVVAGPWALPPPGFALRDGYAPDIRELREITASDAHPALVIPGGGGLFAEITICSGVYHEVRRIFAALGTEVRALARVAYGDVRLPPEMPPGSAIPVDLS